MTPFLKSLAAPLLAALCFSVQAQMPQPPEVAAKSYLLMDITTGQILAERNADTPADPASRRKHGV